MTSELSIWQTGASILKMARSFGSASGKTSNGPSPMNVRWQKTRKSRMKMRPSRSAGRSGMLRVGKPVTAAMLLMGALTTVTAIAQARDGIDSIAVTYPKASTIIVGSQQVAAAPKEAVEADETKDASLEKDIEAVGDRAPRFSGFYQFEGAYTTPSPAHFSKLRNRLELSWNGQFSENLKWKLGGGVFYDAIYDLRDFYPGPVRRDQRFDALARENYLDWSVGEFDFRFGRQHIIWGEVVSLFVADVVSAKDL